MKTRTGFVSNSSSSSFVVTTTKSNWERIKGELDPFALNVAELMHTLFMDTQEGTCFGNDVVMFGGTSDAGQGWYELIEERVKNWEGEDKYEDEDYGTVWRAWSTVEDRLKERPDEYFEVGLGWG